jgi:hypothetical protein
VIGLLRFIGVINAAVWLGGAFFCVFEIRPSLFSSEMNTLLGAGNSSFFPQFSVALAQIVIRRGLEFQIVCAVIAWFQLLAEWLYLGRPSRRFSFSVLAGLVVLVFVNSAWLQPRLREFHTARFRAVQSAEREVAARSYRTWQPVSDGLQLLVIGGLLVYIWRVTNPPDPARFVSSVKFRG